MKTEHILLLAVLAVLGFVVWQTRRGIAPTTTQRPVPTSANQPGIQDYASVARSTIDWVADRFGGWGSDAALPH